MTYDIPLPFTCRQGVFGLFALMHIGLLISIYLTMIDTSLYFALVSVFGGIILGGWICILIIYEPLGFSCKCDK